MFRSFRPVLFCAAAFLAPVAAFAGEIILFQDANFHGRSLSVRSDASDLSRQGFNDKTSSVIVRSGTWEVCKDARYRGGCRVLQPGRYKTVPMNDAISSVREVRRGGNGRHEPNQPPRRH
ncbi:beta/gamma crystallin-related protein [Janthinobacterium sp. HLX7-2]|uniref:beta/gamma crystallin-related protein n=1 Tax=Janthinobacterium sp. HLX7-2 TaxID=1259331 RepID=UPI003F289DB1